MLKPRIIPVLLLRDLGLVKTRQFKDEKYVGDPINAVKIFNEKEVDELTLLDIDATVKGLPPNYDLLRKIAAESRMPLCYGGGVNSARQAQAIIALGFEKVSVSAAALERPALIHEMAEQVGRQSVVITLDVRKEKFTGNYSLYTHNARQKRREKLLDFVVESERLGAGEIMINSIDRDGMMEGYDLKLAKLVRDSVTSPISLVGGAGNVTHMSELINTVGTAGVAAGSVFVFKGPYRAVLITYFRP